VELKQKRLDFRVNRKESQKIQNRLDIIAFKEETQELLKPKCEFRIIKEKT
jgi:hypothetical protein